MKTVISILFLCSAAFSQGGTVSQSSEPLSFTSRTITSVEVPPPLQNDVSIMAADGRKMAHIATDGTVVIEKGYTAEQVLVLAVQYMQAYSARSYSDGQAELQACISGWKHSLDVIGKSLKAGAEPAATGASDSENTK